MFYNMFLITFRHVLHKSTKKLKKLKKKVPICHKFARFSDILYLCSVKRIAYILPIDYMRGNLSGRQNIAYSTGKGYDVPDGTTETAVDYMPRMVAQYRTNGLYEIRTFQVRTKTSVHMTESLRLSLAVMGGAGALYASLVSDKMSAIYQAVYTAALANGKGQTFRGYVMRALMTGLRAKDAQLIIASGVYIVNPWTSSETPNVPVSQTILDKFSEVLST